MLMSGEIFSKDISTENVSPLFSKSSDFLILLVVLSFILITPFLRCQFPLILASREFFQWEEAHVLRIRLFHEIVREPHYAELGAYTLELLRNV